MTRQERIQIRQKRMDTRAERIRLRKLKEQNIDPLTVTTTTPILTTTSTTTSAIIPDDVKLSIEICIHCYKYQRRLCHMLSSILQNTGDLPNLIINISHTDDDGSPTTANVCEFFRDRGLNIVETLVTKEDACNRGKARNTQTLASKADYLLYADCDMVYDIDFMENLHKQLRTNLRDEKKVMGADRVSLKENVCIKYFQEDKREYPCVIDDVAKMVSSWDIKWVTGKHSCPGNFQLVSLKAIKEKGGGYGGRNKDFWRNTKSDRAMRCKMGGKVPIEVKKQYHLNHSRELDVQR